MSKKTKGKTYEEIYGYEKAQELKKKRSLSGKKNKSNNKGKTYEEIYGEEVGKRMRDQRKGKNNPYHSLSPDQLDERNKKISESLKKKHASGEIKFSDERRKNLKEYGKKNKGIKRTKEYIEKQKKLLRKKHGTLHIGCLNCGKKMWVSKNSSKKYCCVECYRKHYKHIPNTKKNAVPNSWEQLILDMGYKEIRYVGNHSFWITFKDGSNKNPDFIVESFSDTRKVIEVWGLFWHNRNKDNWKDVKNKYDELGIKSLFLLDDDILLGNYKEKVINFLKEK